MRGLTPGPSKLPSLTKSKLKKPGEAIPTVTERPVAREPNVFLRTKTFGKLQAVGSSKESPSPNTKRRQFQRNTPRRHTLAIAKNEKKDGKGEPSAEQVRNAFRDMLSKRFPRPDRSDGGSTGSEDGQTSGPPARPAPGKRHPVRRRTTVVTYNPDSSRSTDQDDRNTSLSEVESEGSIQGHGLQRGGPLRSSLPIVRSPNQSFDRSLGLVFLVYGDETKRCVLPNEITHLDTVRALFVQCFHDKLNMPLLESRPQLKIYIQDSKTRVFYQLEDLRDIEEHSILKLHYCDSTRPQKVKEYPKSRGKTILSPPPPVKSASPPVNKPPGGSTDPQSSMQTHSLPNRNFLDPASQQMRDHPDIRYRPLTPDVAHTSPDARWRQVAVDDHRRVLPERPFSPDRLALGTIPENRQSSPANRKHSSPRDPARSRSAQSTPVPMMEVMVPSSGRSTPTPSLQPHQYSSAKYRPLSPTPEPVSRNAPLLPHRSPPRHYSRDPAAGYHSDGSPQVKQGPVFPPQTQMYVAKGVRAATCTFTSPQRATGPPKNHQPLPHPQQPAPQQQALPRDSRDPLIERGNPRHSLSYAPVAGMPPIHRQPMTRSLQERGEGPKRPHNLGPPTSVSDGQICQRSQSYRVPGDRSDMRIRPRSVTPQPQDFDPESRFRIEKMEAQLANLTAWVHSTVSTNGSAETGSRTGSLRSLQSSSTKSSASSNSLNDLSTVSKHTQTLIQSTPLTIPKELANGLLLLHKRTIELKVELKGLRRLQQLNLEGAKESIDEVYGKIKIAMTTVPGVNNKPVRQKRFEVDTNYDTFKLDKEKVQRELRDLESSVEEMRGDVISRQCRVNMSEVEAMALSLSQITKSLADLKGRLPPLIDSMKSVMSGEMEIVVGEERFVKEEPESIESCLKKCKKLTGTLFTMKRLASVQEQRPPQIPVISTNGQTTSDKLTVLENIQSVVPNHDARLQSLEAADASRERKKRLASQQEALKFEKKLELATKNLKSGPGKSGSDSERSTPESEGTPVIQATQSSEKINNLGNTKVIPRSKSLDQDNDLDDPDSLSSQKQAARAEFFRSLSSTPPKTSPQKSPNRDYEILIPKSQANASSPQEMTRSTPELSSPASPSASKLPVVTAQITQPEQSAVSSAQPESVVLSRREPQPGTPTPAQRSVPKTNRGEKYDKRRLPPPPPPRSSVKTSGQSQPSFSSFYSTITSPSKLDDSSADNINANLKSSRMVGGPISSTPLVGGPKKPANNFEKGIMNVYVNVHQSAEGKNPENRHVLRSNVIESPSDNGNDQESEAESTSSVDSQNEVWRLLAAAKGQSSGSVHGLPKPDLKHTEELKSVLARKKPPPPPQRKSSVLSRRDLKEQTTKTHHLQDQHNRLGKVESEQGHLSKQHQILEDEQKQLAKAKKKP